MTLIARALLLLLVAAPPEASCFNHAVVWKKRNHATRLRMSSTESTKASPSTKSNAQDPLTLPERQEKEDLEETVASAATGTVNERLIAELQEASDKEKFGARSSVSKKFGFDAFRSSKTDEERQAAIEEARNLNGVNPLVTLAGAVFALGAAYGLWAATTFLSVWFAANPVESEVFFITRTTAVFRNVVVGLVSLASGFFGVTGLGILLLTFRVAYGVMNGSLDPTPIVNNKGSDSGKGAVPKPGDEFSLGNAWDLMLNKKPSRRRSQNREDTNDGNSFGI